MDEDGKIIEPPSPPFRVKALYSLETEKEGELSLEEGLQYTITEVTDEWWMAHSEAGLSGWIPANYVEPLIKKPPNVNVKKAKKDSDESDSDDKAKTCGVCNKKITDSYIQFEKQAIHKECFRCCECGKELAGEKFSPRENKFYCDKCSKKKFNPRCGLCDDYIEGEYVKALDKNWHKDHFVCCDCGEPFKESYINHENNPYCQKCFEKNFVKKCGVCGKRITNKMQIVHGIEVHPDCFECCVDKKKLSASEAFKMKDKKFYCAAHYKQKFKKLCHICNQEIEGKFVHLRDKNYHKKCFVCSQCGEPLSEDKVYAENKKLVCKKHSGEVPHGVHGVNVTVKKVLVSEIKHDDEKPKSQKAFEEEKARDFKLLKYEDLCKNVEEVPDFVSYDQRERHLSDGDFVKVFKMSKEDFFKLTLWKQRKLKRDVNLF